MLALANQGTMTTFGVNNPFIVKGTLDKSVSISNPKLTVEDIQKLAQFGTAFFCDTVGETLAKAVVAGIQEAIRLADEHLKQKPVKKLKSIQNTADLKGYFTYFAQPANGKDFWFFKAVAPHLGGSESTKVFRLKAGDSSPLENFQAIATALGWTEAKTAAALIGLALDAFSKASE